MVVETTVNGHQLVVTRERVKPNIDDPRRPVTFYWVVTIDGTRLVGWESDPGETEASVRAALEQWIEKHPLSVSPRTSYAPTDSPPEG